jgi:hypothetical protein
LGFDPLLRFQDWQIHKADAQTFSRRSLMRRFYTPNPCRSECAGHALVAVESLRRRIADRRRLPTKL